MSAVEIPVSNQPDDNGTDPADQPLRLRETLSYTAGDIGMSFVSNPVISFVLFYLTNIAGIGAAIAGTILLIGQLLNGITDFVIGFLIDKTSTRWGKLRPWILFSAPPFAVAFVLLFSVPAGFNETAKVVWALVSYTLVMAVFYTSSSVAYNALMSVMTTNDRARVTLMSFRFFATVVTAIVANVVTLPLVEALGNDQQAWTSTTAIFATISVVTAIIVFAGTRERVRPRQGAENSSSLPFGALLKLLFKNKYFFGAIGLLTAFQFMGGLSAASGAYFANDILGNASIYGLLTVASLLPTLIGLPFMPAVMARFGRRKVTLAGFAVMVVGGIVTIIDPTNLPLLMIGLALRGFGIVPMAVAQMPIVADVVDYGDWRNGIRIEGLTFSVTSLGYKLGTGLSTAVVGWLLAWAGYTAAAGVQQSSTADFAIVASYLYLPLAFSVVTFFVYYFFNIERHSAEIKGYLANRRRADGERDARDGVEA